MPNGCVATSATIPAIDPLIKESMPLVRTHRLHFGRTPSSLAQAAEAVRLHTVSRLSGALHEQVGFAKVMRLAILAVVCWSCQQRLRLAGLAKKRELASVLQPLAEAIIGP